MAVALPAQRRRELLRAPTAALLADAEQVAATMTARVVAAVSELERSDSPELVGLVRTTCAANTMAFGDALLRGTPPERVEPTPEAIESTRAIVRAGVSLAAVLRAYRVGHAYLWERWSRLVAERVPADELVALLNDGSAYMFAWIDRVCDLVTREYEHEREQLQRNASIRRTELVRALLEHQPVDLRVAERTLGYRLAGEGMHVAALLWAEPPSDGAALDRLDAAARALIEAAGAGMSLVVAVAGDLVWAWLGDRGGEQDARVLDTLEQVAVDAEAHVAIGDRLPGLDGFRTSHAQAQDAMRVARLAQRSGGRVTSFRAVELSALCSLDVERARAFVRRELGPLAADDDATARLRATLHLLFEERGSYRRTARRLQLHHNTVIYRVRRAEELLGHTIATGRLSLELALALADAFGDAVLREPDATAPPSGRPAR